MTCLPFWIVGVQEQCNVFWTAIGAVLTLAATIAALGIAFVLPRWLEPKLDIEFRDREPFRKLGTPLGPTDLKHEVWWRARIRNRGRSAARDCTVKIMEIRDQDSKPWPRYDPTTVLWTGEATVHPRTLNRDEYDYADIIKTQVTRTDTRRMCIVADTTVNRGVPFEYKQGKYFFRISVYADNARCRSEWYNVDFTGDYNEVKLTKRGPRILRKLA